jgi:hypothetical protein
MESKKIVVSRGIKKKGFTQTPTAEVIYQTLDEKTGKKTSITKHEVGNTTDVDTTESEKVPTNESK